MNQQPDLKTKLSHITAEPDASLWPTILSTLKRRSIVRAVLVGASICVLAIIVATSLIWRDLPSRHSNQPAPQQIDSAPAPDTVAPAPVAVDNAVKTSEPQTPKETAAPAPRKEILSESEINELLWHEVSTQFTESAPNTKKVQPAEAVKSSKTEKTLDPAPSQQAELADQKVTAKLVSEKHTDSQPVEPAQSGTFSEPDETALSMPNIMLLNDPNIANRQFRVYANEPIKSFKVYIYNRGGRQVYQSDNINNAWDGTYKGTQVPQGTYAYIVFYTDKDGNSHREKGSITVVK